MKIDYEAYAERAAFFEKRRVTLTRWIYRLYGLGTASLLGTTMYFIMFVNGFIVIYVLLIGSVITFMISSVLSAILVAIRDNPPRKRNV